MDPKKSKLADMKMPTDEADAAELGELDEMGGEEMGMDAEMGALSGVSDEELIAEFQKRGLSADMEAPAPGKSKMPPMPVDDEAEDENDAAYRA